MGGWKNSEADPVESMEGSWRKIVLGGWKGCGADPVAVRPAKGT